LSGFAISACTNTSHVLKQNRPAQTSHSNFETNCINNSLTDSYLAGWNSLASGEFSYYSDQQNAFYQWLLTHPNFAKCQLYLASLGGPPIADLNKISVNTGFLAGWDDFGSGQKIGTSLG
jgi:hypothetical protein